MRNDQFKQLPKGSLRIRESFSNILSFLRRNWFQISILLLALLLIFLLKGCGGNKDCTSTPAPVVHKKSVPHKKHAVPVKKVQPCEPASTPVPVPVHVDPAPTPVPTVAPTARPTVQPTATPLPTATSTPMPTPIPEVRIEYRDQEVPVYKLTCGLERIEDVTIPMGSALTYTIDSEYFNQPGFSVVGAIIAPAAVASHADYEYLQTVGEKQTLHVSRRGQIVWPGNWDYGKEKTMQFVEVRRYSYNGQTLDCRNHITAVRMEKKGGCGGKCKTIIGAVVVAAFAGGWFIHGGGDHPSNPNNPNLPKTTSFPGAGTGNHTPTDNGPGGGGQHGGPRH